MSQSLPERSPESEPNATETESTVTASRVERASVGSASDGSVGDLRRAIECAVLAFIGLGGVWLLRFTFESRAWCAAELISIAAFTIALIFLYNKPSRLRTGCIAGSLGTPLFFAVVARQLGSPIPFEMSAIATLGVGSLALALCARSRRNLALSVVTSGFLILFTAMISDSNRALTPALLWITFCLWHMVANHWERVSSCTPDQVRRSVRVQPLTVLIGLAVFVFGGWMIHGRASKADRFTWGIMPASGGSSWSDPAARSGVGSGDAAIAAKDHAESFGAVESELFLESTESTLYDMFSDSLGQPKLKQIWEKRQGMTPEKIIEAHQRTAKSERGGSSFSTSRDKPIPHQHLSDAKEPAVVQWIGPTGIRLAMNRYDTFDGVLWSQDRSWKREQLKLVKLGEEDWFFSPEQASRLAKGKELFRHGGILKVMRLDSTRIPAPMMTGGVYIKDIQRRDFFGIEDDGSLYMPGRVKIPPLTIIHMAASKVMEDDLLEENALADRQAYLKQVESLPKIRRLNRNQEPVDQKTETAGRLLAAKLAKELTAGETNEYRQLQAIVEHLRDEFEFDRQADSDSDDPLERFFVSKRGGDHLFATAAAEMGRAIGLNTRLVSGFYVRPSALDVGQGHASVVAEDVHTWTEVQLKDGRWMEVEPTPGYRQPKYHPSNWLLAKRYAAAHWKEALSIALLIVFVYFTRVLWFELAARSAWLFGRVLPDRQRVRVLLGILQWRAVLAGKPRRTGMPQRDWLLLLTRSDDQLAASAVECCNAADRLVFGGKVVADWSAPANLLVRQITTRYISRGTFEEISQQGVRA